MGKTAVDASERRLQLKQDATEYDKYKKQDRERKNDARKNLTPDELKKLRSRTLTAVKKYHAGDVTDGTQQLQSYTYGNRESRNKAKSWVLKALPKSPRKRATVLKALVCDILDVHVVNQPSRILPQETVDTVLAFHQNDAFSRVMPGKADCVTVRNSNGEKKSRKDI